MIYEKLMEMLVKQRELNINTNGIGWEKGFTNKGKKIDWLRCIYKELSELTDSISWKHWKSINTETDYDNIKVELVDIYHFLMSYILKETNEYKAFEILSRYSEYYIQDVIDDDVIMRQAEEMMYVVLQYKVIGELHEVAADSLAEHFFLLCKASELTFQELHRIYISKNCLNKFRQDNGYAEGTYNKIWDGREDNVVMLEIMSNMSEVTFDKLYSRLEEHYNN